MQQQGAYINDEQILDNNFWYKASSHAVYHQQQPRVRPSATSQMLSL